MPASRLKNYLDVRRIPYELITHPTSYGAQQTAESAHIPGHEFVKTVVVKADGNYAIAVIPAPFHIDLDHMADEIGADEVKLASEADIAEMFPDCELGAMPPFAHLYGYRVYVAEAVTQDRTIAFPAGSHSETMRLRYSDFADCVHPSVLSGSALRR